MLSERIINWYKKNGRDLPWRKTKNPYFIWLSEIILQQTRVDQGLPYYLKFVKKFPSIFDLSKASESEVLKAWQGLGYYSRARNLHFTAKYIAGELHGDFPNNYDDLLKLKGIGPYTAAAISSISFGQAKAVVDGNVYRVLSRLYENETPINSSKGISEFQSIAQSLISETNPSYYNQGIMEIGARICLPKNPLCNSCPINESCIAFSNSSYASLPIKLKKVKIRNRYFNYLVLRFEDKIYLKQRTESDIWNGLYEFYLFESDRELQEIDELMTNIEHLWSVQKVFDTPISKKQILTHQRIYAKFWPIHLSEIPLELSSKFMDMEEIKELPVHRLVEKYLLDNL